MSDKEDKKFPAIHLNVGQGRDHLTAKTMKAFDYIYKHHRDEADWFLKADDDTFVILENLRFLLAGHSPRDPVYFGHHFKVNSICFSVCSSIESKVLFFVAGNC